MNAEPLAGEIATIHFLILMLNLGIMMNNISSEWPKWVDFSRRH